MAGPEDMAGGRFSFKGACDFFRAKQPMPTETFRDLQHAMHDRAFVLAGVTRQDVLCDVQRELLKALEEGTPLKAFQERFEQVIAGRWAPKNAKGEDNTAWRARVAYETNMRSAYNGGRYRQLLDLRKTHPYWCYRHGDSRVPRRIHLNWDRLVLSCDDPWWKGHYPQNDWGCTCYVDAWDDFDLEEAGKAGPDKAPEVVMIKHPWGDGSIEAPSGVGPGWGYAPGENWARWPARSPQGRKGAGSGRVSDWEIVGKASDWAEEGRPSRVPMDKPNTGRYIQGMTPGCDVAAELRTFFGAEQKTMAVQAGEWTFPLVADAQGLGGHIAPGRAKYLGFLEDMAEDPYEVWVSFLKRKDSDQVVMRWKVIKAIQIEEDGKQRGLFLVAEGNDRGLLEAVSFLQKDDLKNLNKDRKGKLVFARQ